MPTPAKPIPSPRVFVLAARSWYRASSRRPMPQPSSTTTTVFSVGSVSTRTLRAPESRALATTSERIVSSMASG